MTKIDVRHGDCRDVIKTLADCSIDSCVTDPPYSLVSIQKRFGKAGSAPAKSEGATGVYRRASSGFMGQSWDTGETAFNPEFWAEVLRVLKPGAHLLAFSGTRTYHRMACAIEDAGFEIRDQVGWLFGSGFPKSHDVSKAIDPRLGAEREPDKYTGPNGLNQVYGKNMGGGVTIAKGDPITAAGWGTALKPAWEPICLARKPLAGTVAANVLKHGTGALNIDGCRVEYANGEDQAAAAAAAAEQRPRQSADRSFEGWGMRQQNLSAAEYASGASGKGRWPANVIHDGSAEVERAFEAYGEKPGCQGPPSKSTNPGAAVVFMQPKKQGPLYADLGSAARFFYSAKADAEDRLGSKHPTVKPIDLIAYLARLVTPPGGLILDPFAGTGTLGAACMRAGFRCILIEREAQYVADIKKRLDQATGANAPLFSGIPE